MKPTKIMTTIFILVLLFLGWSIFNTSAIRPAQLMRPQFVSANPNPINVTQPDGTNLTIQLVGDENNHYTKTVDGYTIMEDSEGFYCYVEKNSYGDLVISDTRARNPDIRSSQEMMFLETIEPGLTYSEKQLLQRSYEDQNLSQAEYASGRVVFPTKGKCKFLVILVNFNDKAFVKTKADLSALYNTNTPSFKGYYYENSYGLLTVTVDVVGPYNLSGNMAYYGANNAYGNDIRPREMVAEAIDKAEADGVNFANYDNNGDGYVDGIQVVHAGCGEEAGAPAATIWSHRWFLPTARYYDGKNISDYSTVPELTGTSRRVLTGIGVLVHEFGHNLGAPDTYDTDYSNSGGQAFHAQAWDVMASGSWNNDGFNPSHFISYHKWIFGWLTPTTISNVGNYILNNYVKRAEAYKIDTSTPNEYFLLENRQKTGIYDYYLPGQGMLIWHIDGPWVDSHYYSNNINADPSHQGIDLEEADNLKSTGTYSGDPFPGSKLNTSFSDITKPDSKSWAGANSDKPISNIVENNGEIKFTITNGRMSVHISGPSKGYARVDYTWCAIVTGTCLKPPYTYDWRYCYDGENYNHSLGATECITKVLKSHRDLYLKVTVKDSAGKTAVDYHYIMNMED